MNNPGFILLLEFEDQEIIRYEYYFTDILSLNNIKNILILHLENNGTPHEPCSRTEIIEKIAGKGINPLYLDGTFKYHQRKFYVKLIYLAF